MIEYIQNNFNYNSSSSHGLYLNIGKEKPEDYYKKKYEFCFESFLLSSEEAKSNYMASMVFCKLIDINMPINLASFLVKNFYKIKHSEDLYKTYMDNKDDVLFGTEDSLVIPFNFPNKYYVDEIENNFKHYIKHDFLCGGLNKEFIKDMYDFIRQENIVIYGMGPESDDLSEDDFKKINFPTDMTNACIGRKDDVYNYWTLFNPDNGHRIRMRFSLEQSPITRSSVPESVDMKITEKCSGNCPFCYQSSDKMGNEGLLFNNGLGILEIIKKLSEMEVFEICFGGGEPTEHSSIGAILKATYNFGICPNITTGTFKWLEENTEDEKEKRETILKYTKAIAYSVNHNTFPSNCDIEKTIKNLKKVLRDNDVIQMALGTRPQEEIIDMCKICYDNNIKVSLLGYKTFGKGNNFIMFPYDKVIYEINKYNICIDTSLYEEWKEKLVEDYSRYTSQKEGMFTCYIDAVKGTINKCSYMDNPVKLNLDNFKAQYNQLQSK